MFEYVTGCDIEERTKAGVAMGVVVTVEGSAVCTKCESGCEDVIATVMGGSVSTAVDLIDVPDAADG